MTREEKQLKNMFMKGWRHSPVIAQMHWRRYRRSLREFASATAERLRIEEDTVNVTLFEEVGEQV